MVRLLGILRFGYSIRIVEENEFCIPESFKTILFLYKITCVNTNSKGHPKWGRVNFLSFSLHTYGIKPENIRDICPFCVYAVHASVCHS